MNKTPSPTTVPYRALAAAAAMLGASLGVAQAATKAPPSNQVQDEDPVSTDSANEVQSDIATKQGKFKDAGSQQGKFKDAGVQQGKFREAGSQQGKFKDAGVQQGKFKDAGVQQGKFRAEEDPAADRQSPAK